MGTRIFVCVILSLFCSFVLCSVSPHRDDPCHVLNLKQNYDVVVVGSGLGGSVSARRLAEFHNGKLEVLLVERGVTYASCPLCHEWDSFDITYPNLNYSAGAWIYSTPQTHIIGHPQYRIKDPAIQGGGGSLNGECFIRSQTPRYYDTFFPPNWSYNDIYPYLSKFESYIGIPNGYYGPHNNFNYAANNRGKDGLLKLTQIDGSASGYFAERFFDAARTVWTNVPSSKNNSINNSVFGGFGLTYPEGDYYNLTRSSPYSAYIESYKGHNIRSIAQVRVNKVLFRGKKVSGVELVFVNITQNSVSSTCVLNARTVVSSGSVWGTPKLLKLSGIGPASELQALGIPVIVNNPEVGKHFNDQIGFKTGTVSGRTPNPADTRFRILGVIVYNVDNDPNQPADFCLNILNNYGLGYFGLNLVNTNTTGEIRLKSANPDDQPIIDAVFLASEYDRSRLAKSLNQTLHVIKNQGLNLATEPCANYDCSTLDNLLNAYILANQTQPGDHWVGTARMGDVTDPYTLAVYGVDGLYVVDASIIPYSPSANTMGTIYPVSERAIQLVINHRVSQGVWH